MKTKVLGLMTVMALGFTVQAAQPKDQELGKLPEFKTVRVEFKLCTANAHEITVNMGVQNFSTEDLTLPVGYTWATAEENAAATKEALKANMGRYIAYMSDNLMQTPLVLQEIVQSMDSMTGEWQDGYGTKRVSLGLRVLLETKMALMKNGKYSANRIHLPSATLTIDPMSNCEPTKFRHGGPASVAEKK